MGTSENTSLIHICLFKVDSISEAQSEAQTETKNHHFGRSNMV